MPHGALNQRAHAGGPAAGPHCKAAAHTRTAPPRRRRPADTDAATTATAIATTTTAPAADGGAPTAPMSITTMAQPSQCRATARRPRHTSALTIHLWRSRAREALLLREPGGALRLELRSVEVEFHRGRVLVETHREVDGRTHPRFALLGPRRAAEPWRDAVARAVRGALRLDAAQYTVHHDDADDDADAAGGGTAARRPPRAASFPAAVW